MTQKAREFWYWQDQNGELRHCFDTKELAEESQAFMHEKMEFVCFREVLPQDDWQPIEKLVDPAGGVWRGHQDGVEFSMVWHMPLWFKDLGETGRIRQEHRDVLNTGGWVVQGYGLACYDGLGFIQVVKPTHFMPRRPRDTPPESE